MEDISLVQANEWVYIDKLGVCLGRILRDVLPGQPNGTEHGISGGIELLGVHWNTLRKSRDVA